MQKSPNGEAFTKDKQYKTSTHVYDVKGAEVPDPSAPNNSDYCKFSLFFLLVSKFILIFANE